ncbi:MAG: phosphotransferase [Tissierellia bacterium]|nr:phosphotransferase [Tissierellia bacterium]
MENSTKIHQAVILAAGERKDFNKPAAFLEIEETVIIKRLLKILKDKGLEKIIIVVGYKSEYFDRLDPNDLEILYSDRFKWTGSMHSLSLVENYIDEDFLLIDGDLIFEERAIDYLLKTKNKNTLVIVNESGQGGEKLVETRNKNVFRISKDIHQLSSIDGEFIGLSRIAIDTYRDMLKDFKSSKNPYLHYEYVLMNVKNSHDIGYGKIDELVWSQLDTQRDLENLKSQIYPRLKKREAQFRQAQIKNIFLEIMGDQYEIEGKIEKLGGMNNNNYKVSTNLRDYVLRLPGRGSNESVNRDSEAFNSSVAREMGIDCKTVYFDEKSGLKITEYIEEAETLNVKTARREDNMEHMAGTLNILHHSGRSFYRDFEPFKEMEEYINTARREDTTLLENYENLDGTLAFLKSEIKRQKIDYVPCHLDAWPENFVKGTQQIYLIDWEYSANYDKLWDVVSIGLECEYTEDEAELFYSKYFGRNPSAQELERMDILRILMDIYWSLWAASKVASGESDLLGYSIQRYARGISNIKLLK